MPCDLSLVLNILPSVVPCMQSLIGHLCLYAGVPIGGVLLIQLGLVPTYLCTYLLRSQVHFSLRLQDVLHLSVLTARTQLGKKAFYFLERPPERLQMNIIYII